MSESANNRAEWSFASGWVAALESRMVQPEFYDRLLQAETPTERLSSLGGSLLAECELDPDRLKDSENEIALFYRTLMGKIRDKSPFSHAIDLMLWQRDLRDFRNHLKRNYLNLKVTEPGSAFRSDFWESLWNETAPEAAEAFKYVAKEANNAFDTEETDIAAFDAAFDSAILVALRRTAAATKSSFITEYWDRYDTAKGIEFLWRAKILNLPENVLNILLEDRVEKDMLKGLNSIDTAEWPDVLNSRLWGFETRPQTGDKKSEVQRLREFVDSAGMWLMDYARGAKLVAFGPERVFGAVVGLDSEAHNMRVSIVGRANGISADLLKKHLKTGYV